jgi:very-short-patch-repair endonuclease
MSIELSRKLRKRMSPVEATMRNGLRLLRGYHFRRQVPLGRYYADFASHTAKLVIELDGDTHATTIEYDRERDRFMRAEGYEVMRFPNTEVMGNLDGVLLVIANWLEAHPVAKRNRRARSPTPP